MRRSPRSSLRCSRGRRRKSRCASGARYYLKYLRLDQIRLVELRFVVLFYDEIAIVEHFHRSRRVQVVECCLCDIRRGVERLEESARKSPVDRDVAAGLCTGADADLVASGRIEQR